MWIRILCFLFEEALPEEGKFFDFPTGYLLTYSVYRCRLILSTKVD